MGGKHDIVLTTSVDFKLGKGTKKPSAIDGQILQNM